MSEFARGFTLAVIVYSVMGLLMYFYEIWHDKKKKEKYDAQLAKHDLNKTVSNLRGRTYEIEKKNEELEVRVGLISEKLSAIDFILKGEKNEV